jgi:hypothetical protein
MTYVHNVAVLLCYWYCAFFLCAALMTLLLLFTDTSIVAVCYCVTVCLCVHNDLILLSLCTMALCISTGVAVYYVLCTIILLCNLHTTLLWTVFSLLAFVLWYCVAVCCVLCCILLILLLCYCVLCYCVVSCCRSLFSVLMILCVVTVGHFLLCAIDCVHSVLCHCVLCYCVAVTVLLCYCYCAV